MKLSESLSGIVAKSVINNVLEGTTEIDLDAISTDNTTARAKYGTDTKPTIDTALVAVQNGNMYSKDGTDDFTFPRDQALQIARSIAVAKGTLESSLEYDQTVDFSTAGVDSTVRIEDIMSIGTFHFFADIDLNDGTTIYATTTTRDIEVFDGYYGNLKTTKTLYQADGLIIDIGAENETSEQRIDDGSVAGGLYLVDTVTGLVAAAQQRKLVNADLLLRVAIVRDGKLLFGPIRVNKLKIDKVTHTVNLDDKQGLIQLGLVKSWDKILNTFGLRAAHADHLSRYPTDNFLRYTNQVQQTFTWKETR